MFFSTQPLRYALLLMGFLALLAPASQAQTNFQPGYLITLEGDSLKGWVDEQGHIANARSIQFKAAESDPARRYFPHEIAGFGIGIDQQYETHVLEVDMSPGRQAELAFSEEKTPDLEVDSLFLMVYVKGRISMYHFRDETTKNHFFIQKGEGPVRELIDFRYKEKDSFETINANKLKRDRKYLRQLHEAFFDCPSLKSQILKGELNDIPFKSYDIQQLIIAYNQCAAPEVETYVKDLKALRRPRLEVGLVGGATFDFLSIRGTEGVTRQALVSTDFEPALGYAAGLSFHIRSREVQGKWGFYSELLWHAYEAKSDVTLQVSNSEWYRYQARADLQYLRLLTSVRYNYFKGKWRPFAHLGFSTSALIREENSMRTESNFFGVERETEEQIFQQDPRRYELAVLLGGGVTRGRLSGELRCELGNGFSPISGADTHRSSIYLLLGYRLNR
jgi:hypothetical protein